MKKGIFPFVTENSDIESYFVPFDYLEERIRSLGFTQEDISDDEIVDIIAKGYESAEEKSLKKFLNYRSNDRSLDKYELTTKYKMLTDEYHANREKFAIGKYAYGHIVDMLLKHENLRGKKGISKFQITRPSSLLKNDRLSHELEASNITLEMP